MTVEPVYPSRLGAGSQTRTADVIGLPERPAGKVSNHEYVELKRMIKEAGLLNKRPLYYLFKITWTLGLFVAGVVMLALADRLWMYMLIAVYMAMAFAQVNILSHDAAHKQMFRNGRLNDVVWLVVGGLVAGASLSWWNDKHNAHHANPNDLDLDPDIDLPLYAYNEEQALEKRGIQRFMVKYQAPFFFLVQLVIVFFMRFNSYKFLMKQRDKVRYPLAEWMMVILNVILTLGGLVLLIGPWNALLFLVVWFALTGVHLGMVFAPNHKGMPLIDELGDVDYLRQQVMTARNVRPGWFNDFFYGGLNYQIEHHLFPGMPRRNLRAAQALVSQFCHERGIPYVETGLVESYRQILSHLHEVSAVLRQKPAPAGV